MNFGNRSGGVGVGLRETSAVALVGIFVLWPTAIVVFVVAAFYVGARRIRRRAIRRTTPQQALPYGVGAARAADRLPKYRRRGDGSIEYLPGVE
jgi:hypothetical protein